MLLNQALASLGISQIEGKRTATTAARGCDQLNRLTRERSRNAGAKGLTKLP
jgi:hypothetical protein